MVRLPLNKLSRIAPAIGRYLPELARQMADNDIDANPVRAAMFLSQIHHESAGFNRTAESLNYAADKLVPMFGSRRINKADAWTFGRIDDDVRERTGSTKPDQPAHQNALANILYGGEWGRTNLGNIRPGDGWDFRGGGLTQLTGRANYLNFSMWYLGTDELVREPDRVRTDPKMAVAAAVWFWMSRKLNALADNRANVALVTKKINGGYNGLEDRQALFEKYVAALS